MLRAARLVAGARWGVARSACTPALGVYPLAGACACASAPAIGRVPARAASVSANEIREGELIELDGGLWRVVKREFSRTAQGRAYIQSELRSLAEGIKRDLRFRSDETLEKAELESPAWYTVLYASSGVLSLMNTSTYEQIELAVEELGDRARFVQEGMTLVIEAYKGTPAVITLPAKVTVNVVSMDEGGGVAEVSTGVEGGAVPPTRFKVRVPKFIKVGDRITLDTEDAKYIGRE